MRIITSTLLCFCTCFTTSLFSQTTYLPEGSKGYEFLNRLEIKQDKNSNQNFSTLKPFSRKYIVRAAERVDSLYRMGELNLSEVDKYNLHSLLMDNSEWVKGDKTSFQSDHTLWNTFYKTKDNLLEVDVPDFFLAVNPIIDFQVGTGTGAKQDLFLNKRGVTFRGRIANKIGFSSTITDNQERGPQFFQDYVATNMAVPGVGFYKSFKKTAFDYFDGRGYFTFNVTKYIDVQFGYDKNFIGDGYRSLFLSDFGDSYLFLKLNTHIWKINYQNLFMELMPDFIRSGDHLLDRKYAAMHHLSINATRWLNLGLFESVIFGRKNRFDFEYLNPIIFLRHVEGTVGSPDNAFAGFDFKANVAKRFQFYGQLLLDEFLLKEAFKNNGYWANKYGYQLGVKYVDAFNIKNLDLQFESNRVRPFTYTHYDSVSDYTHYNQPLADPLGANFQELDGILKYQPLNKLRIDVRAIYYYKGLDTLGQNFGGDIKELYTTRVNNFGYFVGGGRRVNILNLAATIGYELKENLFIEANVLTRKETGRSQTTYFNIGLRLNAARRDYNF